MFQCTVNYLIIFYRGMGGRYEVCYCMAGKVRGACVPGCVGVILYVTECF